jgi:hypothetical protein
MKYFTIKKDILATIAYFNLFDYPLRKNEIFGFLGHCDDYREFENALKTLVTECHVFRIGDFYSLQNNYKLAIRRYRGNENARIMIGKAKWGASIIAAFPFVRAVGVSGSLSKLFADENSDIDYFIITAANRLWIARTLLHIFKKLTFLFKKQHFFCMNYFVDEAEPDILEKNIYTATEVVTLLPLRGDDIFENFFKVNNWAQTFFPNKNISNPPLLRARKYWIKLMFEKILSNRFGDAADNFFMRLTARRWDQKTRDKKMDSKGILLSMHTGKHFSKPHPAFFQKKILQRYEKSLSEVFKRYELTRSYLARDN